jgi:hypothetical protein
MYADRVDSAAKTSIKDRLNGNSVADSSRRREITGKRFCFLFNLVEINFILSFSLSLSLLLYFSSILLYVRFSLLIFFSKGILLIKQGEFGVGRPI